MPGVVLLGGEPLGEQIVMWWNFIGRSHDDVVQFRAEWQSDVIAGGDPDGRFGTVDGYDGPPLPAPELPTVRLKPARLTVLVHSSGPSLLLHGFALSRPRRLRTGEH